MRKIIIGVGVIVIILITIVLKREDIYETYKLNQIRNDLINNFNGKFSSRTYPYAIKTYKRYHKSVEELNHYDITGFIDTYIKMAEESINIYKEKERGIEKEFEYKWNYDNTKEKLEKGKDIKIYAYDFAKYIYYDITKEDVLNYENGTFTDNLIEKLKTCLDYEEKDGKIEWQINDTEDKTIELPYNCYINYQAYYVKLNPNFKKAISADMSEYDLSKIDNRITVKYLTKNNDEEKRKVFVFARDKQIYVWVKDVLTEKKIHLAESELKSHTCDRIAEEEGIREHQKYLEELSRRENDPLNLQYH